MGLFRDLFQPIRASDFDLNRVQDKIKGAFVGIESAMYKAATYLIDSGAVVASQVVYGGTKGKFAQSPNLSYDPATGRLTIKSLLANYFTGPVLKLIGGRIDFYDAAGNIAGDIRVSANNWQSTFYSTSPTAQFGFRNVPGTSIPLVLFIQDEDVWLGAFQIIPNASTKGFVWLPAMNGTPTGAPAHAFGSKVAVCMDYAALKMWAYFPGGVGWKSVQFV